jgi:hypothetical protein
VAVTAFAAYIIGILTERLAALLAVPVMVLARRYPGLKRQLVEADPVLIEALLDILVQRYRIDKDFRDELLELLAWIHRGALRVVAARL